MAAALAAPDGWLALIHRADKLGDILAICAGRFGDLRIAPIYPKQGVSAIRVVVRGRKGSRAAPMLRPGLVLHGADGRFTEPAETLHRGRALLSMD
jgi:tRNA1(Val) A37 N6-methylase TrmN6